MRAVIIAVLCATVAGTACESKRDSDVEPIKDASAEKAAHPEPAPMVEDRLNETAWVLEALPERTLVSDTGVFLSFADGRVSGSDGCNRFSTRYTLDHDGLRIDPRGAATLAACPPPVNEQAEAFMKALGAARTAELDGERLTLLDGSGTTLATFAAQPTSLAGTSWQVTNVNNGRGGVTGVRQGTSLTLDFGTDGKLSGSGGCNRFRATYQTEGKTVTIGPAAATRRMCPDPVMEQESWFFAALTGTRTLRFEGDRVELRTETGSLMVSAKRIEGS